MDFESQISEATQLVAVPECQCLFLLITPSKLADSCLAMDPTTHIILTGLCFDWQPTALVAGIGADLPFYSLYPAWVMTHGGIKKAFVTNNWPDPPKWMEELHHAFHSIIVVTALVVAYRFLAGLWPVTMMLAWGLHILIDIPTHSRKKWGPQFLWPFSNYAFDGISWAEAALRKLRNK